jgi:energy-coupling factor transport system ATP-binding protein
MVKDRCNTLAYGRVAGSVPPRTAMLRMSQVSYSYPHASAHALRHIDLRVAPGELVLITGGSGCGKSTLVRAANGLIPHYHGGRLQGAISLAGRDSRATTLCWMGRKAGTLFQNPEAQFIALRVRDELSLALEWYNTRPEMIARKILGAAEHLGIADLLDQSVPDLSEGQKQKVALASLLTCRPGMLLLDEPSSNLDPEATADLAATLARLKNAGLAILVADHRFHWLREVTDRVIVLQRGSIVEQGPFAMLDDAFLRRRHGLRAARPADPRPVLREVSTAEPGAIITCRDLRFAYHGSPLIFDDAEFSLPRARAVALLGANGSGKTTLARLLAGLEKPQTAQLFIDGQPLASLCTDNRVGLVPQNIDHQLHLRSVAEELECAARPCLDQPGRQPDKLADAMGRFGLNALARRHPKSLSGGEKQRLVLACALLRRPAVVILDEPTSGLDGRTMEVISDMVRQLTGEGTTVLMISHDLELIQRTCRDKLSLPLPSAATASDNHSSRKTGA